MTIQKDLRAVSKEMLKQASKIDKLAEAIDKIQSSTLKIKPSKTIAKAKPVRKISKPKATTKKATQPTDTDKVLNILKRLKKGANVKALMNKTDFNEKKIWNIVYRATKSGKINKVGRGLYKAV